MKKSSMRIFNFNQANFLFKNGCEVENFGYSERNGEPYVRFIANELFQIKMKEWQFRKK